MTGELAGALAKAQGEFQPIVKRHKVKFSGRDYKYADLADVLGGVLGTLSKNGLALTQTMRPVDDWMALVTTLMHTSGETIESVMPITIDGNPQAFGSALTYMRRYSVQSILGIAAEEDDDGQAAVEQPAPRQPRRQTPPPVEDLPTGKAAPNGSAKPDILDGNGNVVVACFSYGQAVEELESRELNERVQLSAINRELLRKIFESGRAPADLKARAQLLWNMAMDADLERSAS